MLQIFITPLFSIPFPVPSIYFIPFLSVLVCLSFRSEFIYLHLSFLHSFPVSLVLSSYLSFLLSSLFPRHFPVRMVSSPPVCTPVANDLCVMLLLVNFPSRITGTSKVTNTVINVTPKSSKIL